MPSTAELIAIWNGRDASVSKYYAAGIVGLMALLIIAHWSTICVQTFWHPDSPVRRIARQLILAPLRSINADWTGRLCIAPAKVLLAITYWTINVVLTFYDAPQKVGLTFLAGRLGWMTLCNLCLTVFLGLKNTPLSPLAGKSYETLNALHRCVGYTTIWFLLLHAIMFSKGLADLHILGELMSEAKQIAGVAAGLGMVIIVFTAIGLVRRRCYELFYVIHVLAILLILIAVGIHRSVTTDKSAMIVAAAAAMWAADRIIRVSRWIYFASGNHAMLIPLPNRCTRVVLRRSIDAPAGSHVFLWIPAVCALQTHPFTLVSAEPASFVIKARDGFTKRLHELACQNPRGIFRAAFEGPYGQTPNVHGYERVTLIAGGSGATFTMALAMDWIRKRRTPSDKSSLDFVWIFRALDDVQWFEQELAALKMTPNVRLLLHVTQPNHRPNSAAEFDEISPGLVDADAEKADYYPLSPTHAFCELLRYGRPDLNVILQQSIAELSSKDATMLVAGCGRQSLRKDIERAVAIGCPTGSRAIELHLEEFNI